MGYNMLTQQVLKTINKYNMLKDGDKVLVGVSGGADSVALFLVLRQISKQMRLKIFAASLNHMFRREESDGDVEFVKNLAGRLKIPFITDRVDVPTIWAKEGGSKEDVARKVRYEFFVKAAKQAGADKIAVGHTKDDQAETVLMRLIYGAGMLGLGGIPPKRLIGKYLLIRPLIEVSRQQIGAYLKLRRIKPRVDASNLKDIYRRNKIRNKLLPFLKRYNPKIKDVLSRTAENLRDDYDFLENFVLKKVFKKYIKNNEFGAIKINLKDFDRLHTALKKYLLRESIKGLEYRHWEILDKFIEKRKDNSVIHLPGGYRAKIEDKNVVIGADSIIYSVGAGLPAQKIVLGRLKPPLRRKTTIVDRPPAASWKILAAAPSLNKIKQDKTAKYLDLDKVSLPLNVRFRKPGDRFMPLGMSRHKKLHDFFIDKKISISERDKIPLVISGGEIACVGNIQIADFAKVTSDTKRALKIVFV